MSERHAERIEVAQNIVPLGCHASVQAGQKDERIVQTLGRNTALAADALAVHDRLWAREDVGPHRIVVLGHSLSWEDSVRLGANRYVRFAMRIDPGQVKVDVRLA